MEVRLPNMSNAALVRGLPDFDLVAAATRLDLPPTFIPAAGLVLRMKELDKRANEVCPRSTKRVMFLGM
jgi:hypothetical protein